MALARPEWSRPCDQCRKYIHDDDGLIKFDRRSLPMARPGPPPCQSCPKIPRSAPRRHWEFAADLTPMLAQVWKYYKKCRAVNRFDDDPLVEMCAELILEATEAHAEHKRRRENDRLDGLMNMMIRQQQTR